MNNRTMRWITMTACLAAGAALARGATDASTAPSSGKIHSDKDEMSHKGNGWKDNSTTADPSVSTGTKIHASKERMSRKGNKWKNQSTTAAPSVSTGTKVFTLP